MTRQTASAWGLTSAADDREWMTNAACRAVDPRMFDVVGRHPSAENGIALGLCAGCPVRTNCRDYYLTDAHRLPLGLIAGGWWWDHSGRAHPHPADIQAADARPTGRQTRSKSQRISEHVRGARKAITAGRAKLADPRLTYNGAARRYGTNFRAVCDAVFIGRYAPELLHTVWAGRMTLASAFSEATRRRHAAALADTTPQTGQPAA